MVKLSTVNAIPKMTSNTTPSGIASASSIYGTTNDSYLAFDGLSGTSSQWARASTSPTGWISYQFPTQKVISKYDVIGFSNIAISPKDWTFEGSNDGTTWTVLDTRIGVVWTVSEKKEFEFNNTTPYLKYRLNVTLNNGGGYVGIADMQMFEVLFEKKMSLKNPTTSKTYSLDNETLIHLPSLSDEIIILHGIDSEKEIKLDEDFNKIRYVNDASEVLGDGKTYTHVLNMSNIKTNKIIL